MKIKRIIIGIFFLAVTLSCGTEKPTEETETRLSEVVLVNAGGQRCEVGEMINLISQSKRKAIGIDFLYIDQRADRCDTILRDAISNSGKVILVEGFEEGKHITSNESFLNVAMLSGPTGLAQDDNQVTETRIVDTTE